MFKFKIKSLRKIAVVLAIGYLARISVSTAWLGLFTWRRQISMEVNASLQPKPKRLFWSYFRIIRKYWKLDFSFSCLIAGQYASGHAHSVTLSATRCGDSLPHWHCAVTVSPVTIVNADSTCITARVVLFTDTVHRSWSISPALFGRWISIKQVVIMM